ncbi:MAG: hypothetical protein ACUVXJ_14240 [Phycisphaerae bacterium]
MVRGGVHGSRLAHRLGWVTTACSVLGPFAAAQTTQKGETAAPATHPAYSRVEKIPEELFDDARRSVILLPTSPAEVGQPAEDRSQGVRKRIIPETPLLPEGYVVASREVRIETEGDWLVAYLRKSTDLPDSPPLRILPNQQLSMLRAVLRQSPPPTSFLMTGRITEFMGANYILLENIEEVFADGAESSAPAVAPPQSTPADAPRDREPTAEEILKQLLSRPTRRSVALPQLTQIIQGDDGQAAKTLSRPADPGGAPAGLWPERAMLVDRVGRVVPGDQWWTLVFENRGRQAADQPIRLLPSRLLESAISLSRGGTQTPVFIVSGEVTTYESRNYLLLRKLLVRRQAGNIR